LIFKVFLYFTRVKGNFFYQICDYFSAKKTIVITKNKIKTRPKQDQKIP